MHLYSTIALGDHCQASFCQVRMNPPLDLSFDLCIDFYFFVSPQTLPFVFGLDPFLVVSPSPSPSFRVA